MTSVDTEHGGQRERASRSARERPSFVRLGSIPASSEEDLRFLQDRVALFGVVTFVISGLFLIATTVADLASAIPRYEPLGRVGHFVGSLIALVVWLAARSRRNISARALAAIDVAGTVGISWSFAVMGHFAEQPYGSYTALLALTHVCVARAMIVPSVPLRSIVLGVASFASIVVSRATFPLTAELIEEAGSRSRWVVEGVLWSAAGSAIAAVASKVIYGLQEKAREARQLGQYTLEEKIGEGGMGEVYRAHHAMLRRPTAVKLLTGDGSESQLRRFEREVRLTARLTHPNTISIYDYGRTPDAVFYYAMELLDGLTLEALVQRHGPQPAGRTIRILQQVCGALTEAHGVGMIHRDIKPANIHLCRRGDIADFVKVLDFGLVREIKNDGNVTHSNVNTVVGTPLYLSPEAILMPDRIDARADIYGLGCVGYFLLTGTPPFTGESVVELCAHHLHTPPPPLSNGHEVPADLERVILSCLAKDREDRPASARVLFNELRRCGDAQTWGEADAEAWWTATLRSDTRTAVTPPASGEQPRQTICCGDLEERIRRRERSA